MLDSNWALRVNESRVILLGQSSGTAVWRGLTPACPYYI